MKAYVTYTILDTVEYENWEGTPEEFLKAVEEDAQIVGSDIAAIVGIAPNDIEVELVEE